MSEPEITQDEQDVEGHAVSHKRDLADATPDTATPRSQGDDDVAGHGTVRSKA